MIEFKGVYIQYVSDFYSLYDFSCVINSHTLFVGDFFDGTNAIMRTLSKIDKNYKGEIFIDNINLKNIKDKDLNFAYLPEKPVLFKNKSIKFNLTYPLKIRKINKLNFLAELENEVFCIHNKKTAKNLIFSAFLEFKQNNFNFLDNYLKELNNDLNSKTKDFSASQIENILQLKTKKLTLSEQKIIALIRVVLRKPKYVLLENFFEDLDEEHIPIVLYLIEKLKQTSTIIACEKDETNLELFKDFEIIALSSGNI